MAYGGSRNRVLFSVNSQSFSSYKASDLTCVLCQLGDGKNLGQKHSILKCQCIQKEQAKFLNGCLDLLNPEILF